jgi:hypothetical protein
MGIVGNIASGFVNNPKVIGIAQNPTASVGTFIAENGAVRSLTTLYYPDPNVTPEAKKYSATRDLCFEVLALPIHLGLTPVFEKMGFKIGKLLFKDKGGFKNFNSFADVHKKAEALKKAGKSFGKEYKYVAAMKTGGSVLGAVVVLFAIAPRINNWLTPKVLKVLGMEKGVEKDDKGNLKVPEPAPRVLYSSQISNGQDRMMESMVHIPQNLTSKALKTFEHQKESLLSKKEQVQSFNKQA